MASSQANQRQAAGRSGEYSTVDRLRWKSDCIISHWKWKQKSAIFSLLFLLVGASSSSRVLVSDDYDLMRF